MLAEFLPTGSRSYYLLSLHVRAFIFYVIISKFLLSINQFFAIFAVFN